MELLRSGPTAITGQMFFGDAELKSEKLLGLREPLCNNVGRNGVFRARED